MKNILCLLCLVLQINYSISTDTPIIGVLALEAFGIRKYYPDERIGSYIAASYVKFLESAGARVIPIWIGQNEQYYERVAKYTNGIMFPGGATYFNETKGYAEAAKMIFDIARRLNDMGVYYPLIGICLGMQVLAYASTGGKDIREECDAIKVSLPLEFESDFRQSKVFRNTSDDILSDLRNKNVTYNYHKFCLTDKVMEDNNLTDIWKVVTRNEDIHGKTFISLMEHKKYPFYGFQFHPEKIRFEFQKTLQIPHDISSSKVSQYFAEFSVGECRKNNNTFPDSKIEHKSLIYNFQPVLGSLNCSYFQLYLFTKDEPSRFQLI